MEIRSAAGIVLHRIWNPTLALAFLSCWLLLVMLVAFSLGSCNTSSPNTSISVTCPQESGAIGLSWSITRGGQPSTCDQVDAHSVALRLHNRSTGETTFTAFPCDDASAFAIVPPGLYNVDIELHNDQGARLVSALEQMAVPVVAGHVKALLPVTFHIGGTTTGGDLALMLSTLPFSTNCGPAINRGAAITTTSITLETPAGACVPTTFTRSIGGVAVGTYLVSCGSPQPTTCIENTETVTAQGLPAGSYQVHVRGALSVDPNECWINNSMIEVPPAGGTPIVKTLNLSLVQQPC